jgi:hypothetical protein
MIVILGFFTAKFLLDDVSSLAPATPLRFEHLTYDVGMMRQTESKIINVSLLNTSSQDFLIDSFDATCSCASLDSSFIGSILQGQSRLEFPVALAAGLADGSIDSSIAIVGTYVDDNERTFASTVIQGVVEPDYRVSPPVVDFGVVKTGDIVKRRVQLVAVSDPKIGIESVTSTDENIFEVEVISADAADEETIEITFHSLDQSKRTYRGFVEVSTTSKRMPEIRVPVSAIADVSLKVVPSALVFSKMGKYKSSFQVISVKGSSGEIVGIHSSCPAISTDCDSAVLPAQVSVSCSKDAFVEQVEQHSLSVIVQLDGRKISTEVPIRCLSLHHQEKK